MKSKIFCILLIIILLLSYCNNYLVFPFKIKEPTIKQTNKLITADEYIKYDLNNQISTQINMGTPLNEIEIYLSMEQYEVFLGDGFCLLNPGSKYNPLTSSSFTKTREYVFSSLFTNGIRANDICSFYTELDLSKNIKVKEVDFIYATASPNFYDLLEPNFNCGFLGLQLNPYSPYSEWYSFIFN